MARKIAKRFIVCFSACSISALPVYFYYGGPFDIEFLQVIFLSAGSILNLAYLSLLLEKTDSTAVLIAFISLPAVSSLFLLFSHVLDIRLQLALILATLIIINITATFILRKSSTR